MSKTTGGFKYGAHLSLGSPDYIEELIGLCGLSAIQIFISNPRSFNPVFSQKSSRNLKELQKRHGNIVLCVHMPYVVNLASTDAGLRDKSVEHVIDSLRASSELGARYYVVHPGSGPYDNLMGSLEKILCETAGARTELLVENMEGSGNKLLGAQEQIIDFTSRFSGKAGLCWDTAHAHGAGADTLTLSAVITKAIKLVHLNDSKVEFASNKDRHDGFFTGAIGAAGIKKIIEMFGTDMTYIIEREGHEATCRDLAFIKETLGGLAPAVEKRIEVKVIKN
jgi:endonuclease IV